MIKIKIPSKITIGSHEVELIFDGFQEDKGFRGTYSNRNHTILLSPTIHPQHLRITFLHELIHLICDVDDMNPPEQDVSRLSESLGDFLFRCLDLEFDFSEIPVLERKVK